MGRADFLLLVTHATLETGEKSQTALHQPLRRTGEVLAETCDLLCQFAGGGLGSHWRWTRTGRW